MRMWRLHQEEKDTKRSQETKKGSDAGSRPKNVSLALCVKCCQFGSSAGRVMGTDMALCCSDNNLMNMNFVVCWWYESIY